jgi:hypothetical protein
VGFVFDKTRGLDCVFVVELVLDFVFVELVDALLGGVDFLVVSDDFDDLGGAFKLLLLFLAAAKVVLILGCDAAEAEEIVLSGDFLETTRGCILGCDASKAEEVVLSGDVLVTTRGCFFSGELQDLTVCDFTLVLVEDAILPVNVEVLVELVAFLGFAAAVLVLARDLAVFAVDAFSFGFGIVAVVVIVAALALGFALGGAFFLVEVALVLMTVVLLLDTSLPLFVAF